MDLLRPALALLGAALAVPSALAAEEVPLPCRPTIACTAEFVGPGRAEVELGYAARRIGTDLQHTTPVLLKVTVSERLQLQVGTNGWTFQPATSRYLDDALLLAKVAIVRQSEDVPAVSASVAVAAPTSVGDLGYRPGVDAQAMVYASKDVGPIHGDLNVGLNVLNVDGTAQGQPFAAFSASSDVGHGLIPMAEVYGFAGAGRAAPRDAGFLAALGLALGSWGVLDVGGDVGLGPQDRSFTAFVGLTALSPRIWRP